MEWNCRAGENGGLSFSPLTKVKLLDFIRENPGAPFKLIAVLPESKKQRGFLEGAIIPLVTFYQEGMDHTSAADRERVREWLKEEFNGEMVEVGGKVHRIAKSTRGGRTLNAFLERVMDWLVENYQPPLEAISPESFKHWRDTIFPYGGPTNYIEYLQSINLL